MVWMITDCVLSRSERDHWEGRTQFFPGTEVRARRGHRRSKTGAQKAGARKKQDGGKGKTGIGARQGHRSTTGTQAKVRHQMS